MATFRSDHLPDSKDALPVVEAKVDSTQAPHQPRSRLAMSSDRSHTTSSAEHSAQADHGPPSSPERLFSQSRYERFHAWLTDRDGNGPNELTGRPIRAPGA